MSSTQSNLSHRLWSHMITQGVRISPWTERKDLFENQMILTGWCLANWVFGALGMSLPDSLQHQPVKLFTWAFPRALPVEDQSWVHGEGRVDHKGSQRKLVGVFFAGPEAHITCAQRVGFCLGLSVLGAFPAGRKWLRPTLGVPPWAVGEGKHILCAAAQRCSQQWPSPAPGLCVRVGKCEKWICRGFSKPVRRLTQSFTPVCKLR